MAQRLKCDNSVTL